MINTVISLLTFFSSTINLNSGKKATLSGTGPPLLFSSGLFGTMPPFIYNEFLNNLKNNFTIITLNNVLPLEREDIEDVTRSISVENLAFLSHSSFNSDILETDKINSAVLLDPICLPNVNVYGLNSKEIDVNYPILIVKSDKLYNSSPSIPIWQRPNFKQSVEEVNYENVGHPDILDNMWANIAKTNGFWDTTNGEKQSFLDWNYNKDSIKKIRKDYREFVAEKCKSFILD